jgi:hypothetical protein
MAHIHRVTEFPPLAACIETKFNLGNREGCVLYHRVNLLFLRLCSAFYSLTSNYRYLAGKVSISSKSKFSRSLHRRGIRGSRLDATAGCGTADTSPSAIQPAVMSRLLARLISWLPPIVSLQALIVTLRRLVIGKGWQHANAIAVLLLKLRPLLFCALYAAGQKWAAWVVCIACDITAIKLVRYAVTVGYMTLQPLFSPLLQCCSCTWHGRF